MWRIDSSGADEEKQQHWCGCNDDSAIWGQPLSPHRWRMACVPTCLCWHTPHSRCCHQTPWRNEENDKGSLGKQCGIMGVVVLCASAETQRLTNSDSVLLGETPNICRCDLWRVQFAEICFHLVPSCLTDMWFGGVSKQPRSCHHI